MQMICPYCNQPATYAPNEEYYGKRYGRSYMCYFCKTCDAYVGTHNNTEVPLGTMANRELRQWRRKAHIYFDQLWESGLMERKEAYIWLEHQAGKNIHMGTSNQEDCELVINLVSDYLANHTKKEIPRCDYSGSFGKPIRRCEKEATYKIRTAMGWINYCTKHSNLTMSNNVFAFEKVKLNK